MLEIEQSVAAALRQTGRKPKLLHERTRLPSDAAVARCKLEMETAFRIRHAAAGEKCPAQESNPAAVFLQNGKVDMVGDSCGTIPAKSFKNS